MYLFENITVTFLLPLQIGTGKSHDAVFTELATQVSWGWPSKIYPVTQLYRILSPTSNLVPYKIPFGGTPGLPQELLCNSREDVFIITYDVFINQYRILLKNIENQNYGSFQQIVCFHGYSTTLHTEEPLLA